MWCWWCCHPIDGTILHLPFKYNEKTRKFTTMGNFCSWSCMKAYNVDRASPRVGVIQSNITLMMKHVYNKITLCKMAPKRECLKVFGGTMTIEEFRGCKDAPFVSMPNENYIPCIVNNTYKPIEPPEEDTSGLKLKRAKPLKRNESLLEKAMKRKSGAVCE